MKTMFRPLAFAVLCAALALAPASAPADLFGGGEKARLLERADAAYEAAKTAQKNYHVVPQMAELRKALADYRQLAAKYPDYEKQKVADRLRDVTYTLGALEEKVRRGEIVIPSGELAAAGQPVAGGASAEDTAAKKPASDAPAYRHPIPELVRTADLAPAAPAEAPAPAAETDSAWLREAIPNPLYAQGAPAARQGADPAAAPAAGPAPENGARLAHFAAMIRADKAPAAVMELEDILETEGASASIGTRVMFVRALLACGNYARAAGEAKAIPASADDDPSVLSLRAAVAVSQDDLPRAMLLLSRLLDKFPDFSDAYVDYAYVRFLSDPQSREAHDEAVAFYTAALKRGARRDKAFEEALGVTVE